MQNPLSIWQLSQNHIKISVGDTSYQSWFSSLIAEAPDEKTLVLIAPDEFFKNWIEEHFFDTILSALKEHGGEDIQLALRVGTPRPEQKTAPIPAQTTVLPQQPSANKIRGISLQSRFSFDSFVVGNSNRMAYAASRSVADNPAKTYNPLFIYGQTGLGKTHLMQSIANDICQNKPGVACLYLSSEQFTNELIEAIRYRSTPEFRQKYRNIDVLIVDDIQFIAGRESTQEEFFNTFNSLHNSHKQIIIASDRPPKEIAQLEERLITRFMWGLITDIQPPDYETRVAILRKKIELESVHVPDDVVYFIAEQIKTNIRELEGALIRVVACSLLEEKTITLPMAQAILKDMVDGSKKLLSIEMIQQAVSDHFRISITELKSKRRSQNIALPRQIAMYLTRKMTTHSLPELGHAFGGKDHTTVMYACNKIEEKITSNSEIKYIIEKLQKVLNQ